MTSPPTVLSTWTEPSNGATELPAGLVGGRWEHGTVGAYCHGGCRCGPCRAAKADSYRRWRQWVAAGRPTRPRKHGTGGYAEGCRCDTCRAARNDYVRRYRAQLRQQTAPQPRRTRAAPKRPPDRRWPLRPLLDRWPGTIIDLAARAGVSRRSIHRWADGAVTDEWADLLAVAAGWHPCEIWGADWWNAAS